MGLGKQLHNLMKQIYFSNYGFNIVLITSLHILLKQSHSTIITPQMYQLFLISFVLNFLIVL